MTTFFLGTVDEVRPVQRKNKETGVITMLLQLTATFETRDKEGYLVKSTQDIQMEINDLAVLTAAKGKYILIPYMTVNTKGGTYTFPNEAMGFQVFDKNPFAQQKVS